MSRDNLKHRGYACEELIFDSSINRFGQRRRSLDFSVEVKKEDISLMNKCGRISSKKVKKSLDKRGADRINLY